MSSRVTLEEVEQLVSQLPSLEQLKLVAHICQQLAASPAEHPEYELASVSAGSVLAWLDECDAAEIPVAAPGDVTDDLYAIREERAGRG